MPVRVETPDMMSNGTAMCVQATRRDIDNAASSTPQVHVLHHARRFALSFSKSLWLLHSQFFITLRFSSMSARVETLDTMRDGTVMHMQAAKLHRDANAASTTQQVHVPNHASHHCSSTLR